MLARRLGLTTVMSLCVFACVLAFAGVSARAALIHDYLSQITEVPAGSGVPLVGPVSALNTMAFDSGHLWVAEHVGGTTDFRVDEFDGGTGVFVSQLPQVAGLEEVSLGVAVGHGTVYVGAVERVAGEAEGRVAVFSEAGSLQTAWSGAHTPAGSFGRAGVTDVAVDGSVSGLASGSVYVDDQPQGVVDVFRPEGGGKEPPVEEPSAEHVGQLTGTCPVEGTTCEALEVIPFTSPSHVTVDGSTGDVLVLDSIQEEVEEHFVARNVIDVFEPEVLGGYVFVRQIKVPVGDNVHNIGVDGGSGEVYAAGQTEGGSGFVDQFSSIGVFLGHITGENTPAGDLRSPQSVAVDPVSHHVYVGDYREGQEPQQPSVIDVFGPNVVAPDVTTGPAVNATPYSATLTGTVKLDKEGEATCQFVWGTTTEFDQTPAQCSTPATEEESPVQATLSKATGSELEPDTTYYYRLQATNKNGTNPGEPRQDQQFTTPGPGIHEESVSNVASTSVTFNATINPHNAPTSYYFQYGKSSAYEASVPSPPGLPLGAGEGDVEASPQHVQGLSADTVYHYRVVAISEPSPGASEEFDGPDQTFTTQRIGGALTLLDGRSWEMVTPPQKQGALFLPISSEGIKQASSNGDAIVDLASQPTEAEPQGYGGFNVSVLSTRGLDGWSSQVISPPHNSGTGGPVGHGTEYRFFSEDLSHGIVQPLGDFTSLSPEASESTAYLRTVYLNGDVSAHCHRSCYTPLVTATNTPPGTVFGEEPNGHCEAVFCGPQFLGATPDLSHIILGSPAQLTPTPLQDKNQGLYEWAAGRLQLVSVLPKGEVSESNGTLTFDPNLGLRDDTFHTDYSARHAISNDGSRVIWEGSGTGGRHLYLRDTVKGETVRLDLPQGGMGTGTHRPLYMTASDDDSRIFFLDDKRLTAESSSRGHDLYEYDLDAPVGSRLTDLTVDKNPNEVSDVAQVLGSSEDGSYVYFAAAGALSADAKHGECRDIPPPPGDTETCNLYVHHAGVTRLVAVLSAEDYPNWKPFSLLSVRVSPNGRWLAFTSNRNLTGYDTRDAVRGDPDEEVYLYDASNNRLVCASCDPSGARPVGVKIGLGTEELVGELNKGLVAASVPGWTMLQLAEIRYQSRYLSDSGRLFFDSNDALVPRDLNGTWDVYEYEPPGIGNCTTSQPAFSERSGGCVSLISSGTSAEESAFVDASETGGDVFFLTASKLASRDFDSALDVYDAHECTTQAPCFAPAPVSPPPCSTGDSCKPAPSPQPPVFGSPSSATFSGAGNVIASASVPALRTRSLTQKQKLARALRACRKKKVGQRAACKQKTRKRYGAKSRKANAKRSRG